MSLCIKRQEALLPSPGLVASLIPFLLTSGTVDVGDTGLSRTQLALLDTKALSPRASSAS